jgi:hypothetical protein
MVIFIMSVVCVSEARRQPSSWASNLKIGNGEWGMGMGRKRLSGLRCVRSSA